MAYFISPSCYVDWFYNEVHIVCQKTKKAKPLRFRLLIDFNAQFVLQIFGTFWAQFGYI
mgnify:FL=1